MRGRIILTLLLLGSLFTVRQAQADELARVKKMQADYISVLNSGNTQKALEMSNSAVAAEPNVPALWSDNGAILLKLGRTADAIKSLDKAVAIHPTQQFLANRAQALSDLKRYPAAIADCDEAIKLDPTYTIAYNNRAVAEMETGLNEKALADLNKALSLKPDFEIALRSRGKLKVDKHDYKGAKEDLDKAIALAPSDAAAFSTRATMYWNLKNKPKAVADATAACKLSPLPIYKQSKQFMESNPIGTPSRDHMITDEKFIDALPK